MKRLCFLLWASWSFVAFSEEKVAFDEMFAEATKVTKKVIEELDEDGYGGEFGEKQSKTEKKTYEATLELLKAVAKSDDAVLKARVLIVEFGWALYDCYFDLEEANGTLEKLAIKTRITKYERYLKELHALVGSDE